MTLLGPVSAETGGAELHLGGLKQRAVFALLALNAGRVVSMDRLVDELWRDEPPSRATLSLQSYMSRLRRLLAGAAQIVTRPPGWTLGSRSGRRGRDPVRVAGFAGAKAAARRSRAGPARGLGVVERRSARRSAGHLLRPGRGDQAGRAAAVGDRPAAGRDAGDRPVGRRDRRGTAVRRGQPVPRARLAVADARALPGRAAVRGGRGRRRAASSAGRRSGPRPGTGDPRAGAAHSAPGPGPGPDHSGADRARSARRADRGGRAEALAHLDAAMDGRGSICWVRWPPSGRWPCCWTTRTGWTPTPEPCWRWPWTSWPARAWSSRWRPGPTSRARRMCTTWSPGPGVTWSPLCRCAGWTPARWARWCAACRRRCRACGHRGDHPAYGRQSALHRRVGPVAQQRTPAGRRECQRRPAGTHSRGAAPPPRKAARPDRRAADRGRAGHDALSRYAHDQGEQLLDDALQQIAQIRDPAERAALSAQVRGKLATVRTWTRGVLADTLKHADIGPPPTDPDSAAGWVGNLVMSSVAGCYGRAARIAAQALTEDLPPVGRMAAHFVAGWATFTLGRIDASDTHLRAFEELLTLDPPVRLGGAISTVEVSAAGYAARPDRRRLRRVPRIRDPAPRPAVPAAPRRGARLGRPGRSGPRGERGAGRRVSQPTSAGAVKHLAKDAQALRASLDLSTRQVVESEHVQSGTSPAGAPQSPGRPPGSRRRHGRPATRRRR